jgi:hypothetical protein
VTEVSTLCFNLNNLRCFLCYIDPMHWKKRALVAMLLAAFVPAARAAQVAASHTMAAPPAAQQTKAPATSPATAPATGPATTPAAAPTAPPAGAATAPSDNSPGESPNSSCPGGSCDLPQPHITIATPAPAPAPWSLQDRIKWLSVVLLVVIGYVGVWLAVSTLRKIERQSRSAETAAQAAAESAQAASQFARTQAKALADAERPWVLATPEPAPGAPNSFTVIAVNRGRSPARIVAMADETTVAKDEDQLPPEPTFKTEPAPPREPIILLPGESIDVKSFRREDVSTVCTTTEDLSRVETWDAKIFLYGKIVYEDLVSIDSAKPHETLWCCWYIHGRQKSGLVAAGPRAYNQHT